MAIKFEINMTNKWLYSLIAVGIVLALGVGVWAYNSDMRAGSPPVMGHSAGEINVEDSSGNIVSLQDALDGIGGRCEWKISNAKKDGFAAVNYEEMLSQHPTGICICTHESDIETVLSDETAGANSGSGKQALGGYLESRKKDYWICDDDAVMSGCQREYFIYYTCN
jgi:hypothetical protein